MNAIGTHRTALATDPEELLGRVQRLGERVGGLADEHARALAEELVDAVVEMYGDGLRRIVDALERAGEPGAAIREQLAADGSVASLLLIHDLYPVDLPTRVAEALDTVRPYMESHGGDVELLGVHDGVARLRLQGSCDGCAASRSTLERAIKRALDEHAPDLAGLEVAGLEAQHPPPSSGCELPMLQGPPTARGYELPVSQGSPRAGGYELPVSQGPPRAGGYELPVSQSASRAARNGSGHDERCELCGTSVPDEHRHLLQLQERRILCACEACWALRSGDPEYRPAGMRTVWLGTTLVPDELWVSLQIPIGLAFFMRSGLNGEIVAFYPSPAGATESELELGAWEELVRADPRLGELESDGEALIVNRLGERPQCAIAPIDDCYRLVGLIKARWEGISGGSALERAVPEFFAQLRARAGLQEVRDGAG